MAQKSKKKTARIASTVPKKSVVGAVSSKVAMPIEVKVKKLTNQDVEGMIDKIITRNTKDKPPVKEKYHPPNKTKNNAKDLPQTKVEDKKVIKRNKQAYELKQEAKKKAAQIQMEAEEIAEQIRIQANQKAALIKQEADRKAAKLTLKSNKKAVKRELKETIRQAKLDAAEKLGKTVKKKPTKKVVPKVEKLAKKHTDKSRVKKGARNILISSFAALVLMVGAGVAYTWYMGLDADSATDTTQITANPKQPIVKQPTQIADNAPESAAVQMITSPITPGSNASITVKTNPESQCTIRVEYNKIASTDSNLIAKSADEYGIVSWAWMVEDSTPVGKWPVTVTCVWRERSAVVVGDLVVARVVN